MTELKIVANIIVKPEYHEEILKELHTLVDATRKEEGCVAYILHQDLSNPAKYTFLETWESNEAYELHNNSEHLKAFGKAVDGKVDGLTVDVIKVVY